MSSDNVIGYVIVETWQGEQPGILGLPSSRALAEEKLAEWRSRQALNPLREWQLAEIRTATELSFVPALPEPLPIMRNLPDTPWWGVA
jgi:hypothetical protein